MVQAICARLDVHQVTVVACVRRQRVGGASREVRRFERTTWGLPLLLGRLDAEGCTHVAMESTGVYWKPWHLLEGNFELVLANAQTRP